MTVMGAIIAGGTSSRMGGQEKAFLMLGGKPLLAHVIDRLAPQVDGLIINSNGIPFRFAKFHAAVVPDLVDDLNTPLAGLHASLSHAKNHGAELVITVPSDTPFLPSDLRERLEKGPAIACSGGQEHYIAGAWPVGLLEDVEAAIHRDKLFRVKDWARRCHAALVEWALTPHDPFFNVNTPTDLAAAERMLHG
jgi:molybdenum cofactor guanylyltransferase